MLVYVVRCGCLWHRRKMWRHWRIVGQAARRGALLMRLG